MPYVTVMNIFASTGSTLTALIIGVCCKGESIIEYHISECYVKLLGYIIVYYIYVMLDMLHKECN